MNVLDRKMFRELIAMRGQALAIALVIAGGVATFVMSLSVLDSLERTRDNYYNEFRFADVFLSLERAPEKLAKRIEEIPGVESVETRVIAGVKLEVAGFEEPITGRLVSIPDSGLPRLNDLFVRTGQLPEVGRERQVAVSESFAGAHELGIGSRISAVINGRRKSLTIVGTVLTPEYIYQIPPGAIIPDFSRYGVLWMRRAPLAAAYDMDGAFNDVALTLSHNAVLDDVIERLDDLAENSGGLGAYGRVDQISHRFLSEEFKQLKQMAQIFPTIFLGVAAFLLNFVVTRVVGSQREQIAALKAFGYTNLQVGAHYVKLIVAITAVGIAIGVVGGVLLGRGMGAMFMDYYKFPYLDYQLRAWVAVAAAMISLAAALAGTFFAIRRAVSLPPAEAMRPEPPASYRRTILERLGLGSLLSQPTRMILRQIERQPIKSLLSTLGIAFACAILVMGSFFEDSVGFMLTTQFDLSEREDISVTFTQPTSASALAELRSLPGVHYAEGYRAVPVRLRAAHHSYRTSITGLPSGAELHRVLDQEQEPVKIPDEGLVLDEHLGKILGVRRGDPVTVEVLEGSRPTRTVPVAALVSQFVGVSATMRLGALNRMMREGHAISGAYLSVDRPLEQPICDALEDRPRVVGTTIQRHTRNNFEDIMAGQMLIFTFFITLLAVTIAVGVVYNSARIALEERSRELASLRVLGYTRGEISYILVGELSLLTLAAIPLGFVIGRGLGWVMITRMHNDIIRVPLVIESGTYSFGALVIVIATVVSAYLVQRKLAHLDLVEALKAKE